MFLNLSGVVEFLYIPGKQTFPDKKSTEKSKSPPWKGGGGRPVLVRGRSTDLFYLSSWELSPVTSDKGHFLFGSVSKQMEGATQQNGLKGKSRDIP